MFIIGFIIIGAALLIKGAGWLVEGGTGLALKSGVSPLVVGLTVISFGTSAPELASSMVAAFKGSGDICFGNVVGSNVANIALVLGIIAIIRPVTVNRSLIRWEIPFMIFISAITYYIGVVQRSAGHAVGIGFLMLFVMYMVHCMKSLPVAVTFQEKTAQKRYSSLVFLVILGIAGLGIGGIIFIQAAQDIARTFGVSEAVIGLTVVALGTSLPELITSLVAILKGQSDISLGNIVGSNIFNILLVLGSTATIHPYSISPDIFLTLVGLPVMMGLAVVLLPFSITGNCISRAEGMMLFFICTCYYILAVLMA